MPVSISSTITVPPDIADKINGKIFNIWWFPVDSKENGISSFY